MSKIIKKLQEENSMCADCMGNFLKSVEAFTGKCQNCNEYYENETNDYCERCGEYFDDFYNVSEEGEDKDEQIRDWIETWHYDNKGLVRPEEMADALNISKHEAQDWIERWQESEEDFRMNESKESNGAEMCSCGHFGGSTKIPEALIMGHNDSEIKGHGSCRECECPKFNWVSYESKSEESFQDYFEIKDDDTIVCDLCGMTWHSTQFGAPDGMYHLMSRHDIEASYESKEYYPLPEDIEDYDEFGSPITNDSDYSPLDGVELTPEEMKYLNEESKSSEWGSWADNAGMTSDDQVKLMQDLGIADKTLKDMGYQNFKRNEEGFMDDIEKLANKVGINLDRDPEQVESLSNEDYPPTLPEGKRHCPRCGGGGEIDKDVYGQPLGGVYKCDRCDGFGLLDTNESKANEESTIDRLRAWQKREDDEWNSLSKEEQDKIHNDYEDEVEAEWNNMSDEERKSYESAGQDFDENDDDDSEDIDNNFQKADPNPEEKITLNEDEMLSKSSESYKALTNNPHIQLNF